MNERIRQLAEQARLLHKQIGPVVETRHMKKKEQDLEKFAELIVRECLKIVEPTEDSGDEWCVTLKGTAQEIKEHFGLQEPEE
jgi:hypothetical protein